MTWAVDSAEFWASPIGEGLAFIGAIMGTVAVIAAGWKGASYLMREFGKTTKAGKKIENDTDFAIALLEEKHVAAVQGAAYGMSPYLRISYATDTESLREACSRIQEFCKELS